MQTVLLHVTAGVAGPRCELRRCAAGGWRTVAGHDLPADPLPERPALVGEHLVRMLLRDGTRRTWEELRGASPDGLRTLLQVDPPELRRLPWELMALHRTFLPHRRHPVVRARDLGRDDIRLEPPLRLLAVVGEPAELPGVEREIEHVAAAGRRIDAEVLVAPSPEPLLRVVARMRPHVLHATRTSGLPLDGRRAPAPRLVVLDGGPDRDAAQGLTDTLLDAGACAVLTVPSDSGDTDAIFTTRLYLALAAGEPVDVAVAHAWEAVPADGSFLPALTVRVPPEQVLRFAEPPGSAGLPSDAARSPEPVDPALELAEAQLARGEEAALGTFRAAARATGRLASAAGRVPLIRMRLVVALARFDRLREAGAELDDLLATPDRSHRAELHLLQAEIALRCGRVSRAAAVARRAVECPRTRAVAVCAALAGPNPAEALTITAVPENGGASGLELAGAAAAELMLLDRATLLLDQARAAWTAGDDADGAARCHARSAVLLMRGHGRLGCAERHLREATALDVPAGSAGWARLAGAHLELLHRRGDRSAATAAVRALLDVLCAPSTSWTPPHRAAALVVDALAGCAPHQRGELLDLLVDRLRRITPPAARAALLAGLSRVPELPTDDSTSLLPTLRDLVRDADRDPALTPADRGLLTLTLAELDRLSGHRAEAEAALAFVRDALPSPLARRAWWAALDRLGPPVSRTAPRLAELAAVTAGTGALPLLAAAFFVERAEAQRDGDVALVRRLVHDAGVRLADAPERNTQWHTRLRRLQEEPARPA